MIKFKLILSLSSVIVVLSKVNFILSLSNSILASFLLVDVIITFPSLSKNILFFLTKIPIFTSPVFKFLNLSLWFTGIYAVTPWLSCMLNITAWEFSGALALIPYGYIA